MGTGNTDSFRKLFPLGHIQAALTAVLKAAEPLRKKSEKDHEDWLTRRLYARLMKIPEFRDGPLDAHLQTEIVSDDDIDADKPCGKIDIKVSCGLGYQVYFAVEAKRLHVFANSPGYSEYVKDGMMRFVTGQYAPLMETGAMLGYVFDGDINKARAGIDTAIRSKTDKLRLKPPKRLVSSNILPDKSVDETAHDLKHRSFTIYHMRLAV